MLPKVWTPHYVDVVPYKGEGANGPIIGEPKRVTNVYVKDQAEVVTTESGSEVISRSTVWFNLADLPAVDSKVKVWPGTPQEYEARVFRTSRLDHPRWPNAGKAWLR